MGNAYNKVRGIVKRPKVCDKTPPTPPPVIVAGCRSIGFNPGDIYLPSGTPVDLPVKLCVPGLNQDVPLDVVIGSLGETCYDLIPVSPWPNGGTYTLRLVANMVCTSDTVSLSFWNGGLKYAEVRFGLYEVFS